MKKLKNDFYDVDSPSALPICSPKIVFCFHLKQVPKVTFIRPSLFRALYSYASDV